MTIPEFPASLDIPRQGSWEPTPHRFDPKSIWAVRAAIASGRPLLLRGEPGIGKSQLARAVAHHFRVPFLYHVVDERSERDDLLYRYDAVARLAEAQVSALSSSEDPSGWRERLAEANFVRPGVLWWAFDWQSAVSQAKTYQDRCRNCSEPDKPDRWTPSAPRVIGPVVLVDEIDKADPSVPNGLLESLGNRGFHAPQLDRAVALPTGAPAPLVFITTNEERELPAAFLRRCLVFQMRFPSELAEAKRFLIEERARVFWPRSTVSDSVCEKIVGQLMEERSRARNEGLAVPGAAEFLDILRVLVNLHPNDEKAQLAALEEISGYALSKNLLEDS